MMAQIRLLLPDRERQILDRIVDLPAGEIDGISVHCRDFTFINMRELNPALYGLGESWVLLFLSNFEHLVTLRILRNEFSQNFFDRFAQLPAPARSLNRLVLIAPEGLNLVSNWDFLNRFQSLSHFTTNMLSGQPALEFVRKRLQCPGLFVFLYKREQEDDSDSFRITKYEDEEGSIRYKFQITGTCSGQMFLNLTFDDLKELLMEDSRFNANLPPH